ncbi:hypothetical protein O181_062340 [Austropuccinia psidii MF-1]|uniref:Uncharacterized protein n=1 Tax=Austropuccinia psidii MF-1 TaxID=1389203 RepID=A0A9Q3I193_9BASI|nr:hypothetical protein [Austropuccinia psidii MF-1]
MGHQLRSPLNTVDLVLIYNKTIETNWEILFQNKWNEPYRLIRQINNGLYDLEELGGPKLARRFSASQVKKLYPRGKLIDTEEKSEEDESINEEEVLDETTESDEE